MCRFLIIKSRELIDPSIFLHDFAEMCKQCNAPDGDRQEDGWGVAIQQSKAKGQAADWLLEKSVDPIWKNRQRFRGLPKTKLLVAHARSASFKHQKNQIEYNQPYRKNELAFVFNGTLVGVKIKDRLKGEIGAQKIFSLICRENERGAVLSKALNDVYRRLQRSSQQMIGFNVGLVNHKEIFVVSDYVSHEDYFALRYYQDGDLTIVCSQEIGSFQFKKIAKGKVESF